MVIFSIKSALEHLSSAPSGNLGATTFKRRFAISVSGTWTAFLLVVASWAKHRGRIETTSTEQIRERIEMWSFIEARIYPSINVGMPLLSPCA
jgi:hypothetical protein